MFVISFQLAKLVADEFFDQGDMEKLQLNITPIVSIQWLNWCRQGFDAHGEKNIKEVKKIKFLKAFSGRIHFKQ